MMGSRSYAGGARLLLVALVAILGLFAPLAPQGQAAAGIVKAQPILLELAANEPASAVRVVVQKADSSAQAEQLVGRLGGSIVPSMRGSFGLVMNPEALIRKRAAILSPRSVPTIQRLRRSSQRASVTTVWNSAAG